MILSARFATRARRGPSRRGGAAAHLSPHRRGRARLGPHRDRGLRNPGHRRAAAARRHRPDLRGARPPRLRPGHGRRPPGRPCGCDAGAAGGRGLGRGGVPAARTALARPGSQRANPPRRGPCPHGERRRTRRLRKGPAGATAPHHDLLADRRDRLHRADRGRGDQHDLNEEQGRPRRDQRGGHAAWRSSRCPTPAPAQAATRTSPRTTATRRASPVRPSSMRTPACQVSVPGAIRVCDFFDKPLVLSFWFTRGGDCEDQEDVFERAYRRYKRRGQLPRDRRP